MADIIHVLPDSVANQIAAGEVIQRPASVVKELVENAIDAGADDIKILLKDAGRTSIQIIDNGSGMTETDARLAFERHATSKIQNSEDLFSISTMGFRGEALASVAAIAHVELKTRTENEELGTYLKIEGSKTVAQEPVQCPQGSNFIIKNLFFNVPARRKFLKKDATELNHVVKEFQRVALANPKITFSLIHNDHIVHKLKSSKIGQRVVELFGNYIKEKLIPVKSSTRIVEIHGYVGHPDKAKKRAGEQFFFINNRFMKNPYFHKAIMDAYEKLMPQGYLPSYFIYFNTDPASIDVNIHPTKTEVKFEDQQAIWQILNATVKESLGKNNVVPSIDFDQQGNIGIPPLRKNTQVTPPSVDVDPNFNPFEGQGAAKRTERPIPHQPDQNKDNLMNWEKLYDDFESENEQGAIKFTSKASFQSNEEPEKAEKAGEKFFQFKEKFILTPVKSGLMIIDQRKAHISILYDQFLQEQNHKKGYIQKQLYPEQVQLNNSDFQLIRQLQREIKKAGLDIQLKDNNVVEIDGVPADLKRIEPGKLLEKVLEYYDKNQDFSENVRENVALAMAKSAAIDYGRVLEIEEMRELVDKLFACSSPNFTPDGQKIISLMKTEDIEKMF